MSCSHVRIKKTLTHNLVYKAFLASKTDHVTQTQKICILFSSLSTQFDPMLSSLPSHNITVILILLNSMSNIYRNSKAATAWSTQFRFAWMNEQSRWADDDENCAWYSQKTLNSLSPLLLQQSLIYQAIKHYIMGQVFLWVWVRSSIWSHYKFWWWLNIVIFYVLCCSWNQNVSQWHFYFHPLVLLLFFIFHIPKYLCFLHTCFVLPPANPLK